MPGCCSSASLTWIVAYDTMYAMVDREDDLKIGIRSTAILFGNQDRLMIALLQGVTLTACWCCSAEVISAGGAFQLGIRRGRIVPLPALPDPRP